MPQAIDREVRAGGGADLGGFAILRGPRGNAGGAGPGANDGDIVAADLLRLKTEIDKLATFVGGNKLITRRDVSTMVISEKTTTVWALADLLAARKSAQALEFLDRLLRHGEEPLPMVGAMAWMYRKLIEASEMKGVTNGWQASRVLGMSPQQAELALQASHKIPKTQLLAGLRALQKADDRLKGGAEDVRAVMEFLVMELTVSRAASAAASR